ncbi:ATPase, partial [Archaeoglobales archaeon ex4484_92]
MVDALISDEAFIKGCAAIGAGLAVGLAGIGAG